MRPFLPLVLVALAIAVGVSSQSVNWVQYINPSNDKDFAYGVCTFGEYLAVAGRANFHHHFVALLDRNTGKVVTTWIGEFGYFINCLSEGDKLYVVGYGRIYTFNKDLSIVEKVELDLDPVAISSDGSYLYLAGGIGRDVDGDGRLDRIWRIEKRTLDLDLVAYRELYKEFQTYKTWERVRKNPYLDLDVYDLALNPATGDI